MPNCITCNNYYRRSKFNPTDECEDCQDTSETWVDEEDDVDIQQILNPTGKTLPTFYEE